MAPKFSHVINKSVLKKCKLRWCLIENKFDNLLPCWILTANVKVGTGIRFKQINRELWH